MLDPAIQSFLDERKEGWLKKKIKGTTHESEQVELRRQAETLFSLAEWLPDAARRAGQLSMVSHPGKFSHPSAKVSSLIAPVKRQADGFLRTGNVDAGLDVLGNAAALDVYKFLFIELADGKIVLNHLEQHTETIKEQFTLPGCDYVEIESGLLAIKQRSDGKVKTSGRVKQVYFPVTGDQYHLLSILTPSSVLFKLKERINFLRYSEEAKASREARKSNQFHEVPLPDIFNLSVIGFGGTKPQNISVLNTQNGGAAYLLTSTPPILENRQIQPPRKDFFDRYYLKPTGFAEDFTRLHKLLASDTNNMHIRKQRDRLFRSIIYDVANQVWQVRFLPAGWSQSDNYHHLPQYQKIWLDQQYKEQRQEQDAYLDKVRHQLAVWVINSYKKIMDKQALDLSDEELGAIRTLIEDCEEAFR